MNKVIEKTTCQSMTAFALFVGATLTMAGPTDLSAAIRNGFGDQCKASIDRAGNIPLPPLPEGAHGNMATGGDAGGAPPAYLALPPILKPDKTDERLDNQTVSYRKATISSVRQNGPGDILTSAGLVSSELGRRATLVGAKPSGTS